MTLADLAALGSFISALAVLASLVYLAIEVRQAEKNQRAVLNQGYITRVIDYLRWYAESPINELRARVVAGDTSFTAEELLRLQLALRLTLLNFMDAHLQHEAGLLDEMTLDNSIRNVRFSWLNQPVYRALWRQQAPTIAPQFAEVIETMLRETPVTKPNDIVLLFHADLAKIV